MRTFLIEHKVSVLTLEDLQEIGVAYQEAHGKPIKSSEKSKKTHQQAQTGILSSTQIWKISLEKILGQLEALPVAKRWSFTEEKKLCLTVVSKGIAAVSADQGNDAINATRSTTRCFTKKIRRSV